MEFVKLATNSIISILIIILIFIHLISSLMSSFNYCDVPPKSRNIGVRAGVHC
jgi:fumarate reductase subunit C